MYHHINSDRCSNKLEVFDTHLKYISENYKSTFPQSTIQKNSICLTFDDAYADFYYYVFPLLKKYKLKALLGVPTKYILDDTEEEKEKRLNYEHNDLFLQYKNATFCTYKELEEMQKSGLVKMASHSHTHNNLLDENVNLNEELLLSKQLLEDKLNIKVDSFIFPFGKFNEEIAKETLKYYPYVFRIGNAIQKDFSGIKKIIYRIDGDELIDEKDIFSIKNMLMYKCKAFIKSF